MPELADRVAAYRAGYLREERRELERALLDGSLLGLAATNALELGIDVAGLDAVLLSGYPGTLASLWQQAGRAGRSGSDALCVLVARDDPLDTYLVHHPEALFGRGVEATVLDPANPYVLAPHLCCAAAELPLTEDDLALFGGEPVRPVLDALVTAGALRRRPTGWYWAGRGAARRRPARHAAAHRSSVVESVTGRLLGTVDAGASHVQVHDGAVYLHQGVSYVVDRLDLADASAMVHAEEPDYTTHARDVTSLDVLSVRSYVDAGPVGLFLGDVEVTNQVVGYQRRRLGSREVLDSLPLDLPPRQLRTVAVWWTISPQALAAAGVGLARRARAPCTPPSTPRSACCRWWPRATAGTSVACRPPCTPTPTRRRSSSTTGTRAAPGFAERAYTAAAEWLSATRDRDRRLRLRDRLPVLRALPEVRQRQRPARQGRRRRHPRRGPRRPGPGTGAAADHAHGGPSRAGSRLRDGRDLRGGPDGYGVDRAGPGRRAGVAGHRGQAGRSRFDRDDDVEPVEVARGQVTSVAGRDLPGPRAGHLDAVEGGQRTGESGQVGRRLGPVPGDDGGADRRGGDGHEHGHQPDREHEDGGAAAIVPAGSHPRGQRSGHDPLPVRAWPTPGPVMARLRVRSRRRRSRRHRCRPSSRRTGRTRARTVATVVSPWSDHRDRRAGRGDPGPGRLTRIAPGRRPRGLAGGVQALQLRPYGGHGGQPDQEQKDQSRQRHGDLGGRAAPVRPVPPSGHCRARPMMPASAARTESDVSTLSSSPANATAASVPTAYSAVFIPSSRPSLLLNARMVSPPSTIWTGRRRARRR